MIKDKSAEITNCLIASIIISHIIANSAASQDVLRPAWRIFNLFTQAANGHIHCNGHRQNSHSPIPFPVNAHVSLPDRYVSPNGEEEFKLAVGQLQLLPCFLATKHLAKSAVPQWSARSGHFLLLGFPQQGLPDEEVP